MVEKIPLNTDLLKILRDEKQFSMSHMAKKAGYAGVSSYSLIESGQSIPSPLRLKRIARELGVKPKELLIHNKKSTIVANPLDEAKFGEIIPVSIDSSLPVNQIVIDAGNGKRVTIQISID